MPYILKNDAEMGTDGVAVDTVNSGGGGNTAWSVVQGGGTAIVTFSNAVVASGALSYKVVSDNAGFTPTLEWTIAPAKKTVYTSAKIYFVSSVPDTAPIQYQDLIGSMCGAVQIISGKIELCDSTGATIATSTTTIPANQWIRIDSTVTGAAAGFIQARIFLNPNSATPTEVIESASNANTTIGNIMFSGVFNTPSTLYFDDIFMRADAYPDPPYNMSTSWMSF